MCVWSYGAWEFGVASVIEMRTCPGTMVWRGGVGGKVVGLAPSLVWPGDVAQGDPRHITPPLLSGEGQEPFTKSLKFIQNIPLEGSPNCWGTSTECRLEFVTRIIVMQTFFLCTTSTGNGN